MKCISWNINGIRAVCKKGFLEWLDSQNADLIFLQEIKAELEQVPVELREHSKYHSYWRPAERKGYSGVAILALNEPDEIITDFGEEILNAEGRMIAVRYDKILYYSIYFPNGSAREERQIYKYDFYKAFFNHYLKQIKNGFSLVLSGDYNTAHEEIDLARPKDNNKNSGFLLEEREWISKYLENELADSFRIKNPEENGHYSWWSYRSGARERNIGWRIDYHMISKDLLPKLRSASIAAEIHGSDHCPIILELDSP